MNEPVPNDGALQDLDPADKELESALSRLRPAATGLDTASALFAAGAAAARRSLLGWRLLSAALAVTTVGSLAARLQPSAGDPSLAVVKPAPATSRTAVTPENLDHRPAIGRPPPAQPLPEGSMLAMRTAVLAGGVEALPRQRFGSSVPPLRIGDLRRQP